MFPIPWNFPLRKKNGNLVNIGDAIDAGTEIPTHDEGDAGKILSVDANGDLEWSDEVNSEIQTLTNEVDTIVNDLGVKNLLKINNVSQTTSGVTISVNNGVITLNGTSTGQITLTLLNDFNSPIKSGSYIFNGLDDGSSNTIQMVLNYYNSQGAEQPSAVAVNGDTPATIPADYNGHLKIYLVIANGQTFNNKVVKPMIRDASIKNSDYVPYAMTNRELTGDANFFRSGRETASADRVSDLDTLLTGNSAHSFSIKCVASNSTNAPSMGEGMVLTQKTTDSYASQLFMNYAGTWFRSNNNGTISTWEKLTT